MSKLTELKKEIQRLRPEIMERTSFDEYFGEWNYEPRDINLEDVMSVLESKKNKKDGYIYLDTCGVFVYWKNGKIYDSYANWILGKSLDDQDEECISLLHKLIVE